MSESLRVPKRRIQAEIALIGRGTRKVELFLADVNPHIQRPERVSDLLEGEVTFLPAFEEGRPTLIGRAAVAWVSVDNGALDEAELELFAFRRDVSIEFMDGSAIGGELLYTAPSSNARVADYLNGAERCFRVWSTNRTFFVAKQHVARVLEVQPVSRAAGAAQQS